MLSANKLGKASRLTTPKDFQRVYQQGRRFRYQGISVIVSSNDLTVSRLGISVPKRQMPRSVDRNNIKRIVRESFRANHNLLETNLDMVFMAYSALLGVTNLEIRSYLEVLWTRLIEFYQKP